MPFRINSACFFLTYPQCPITPDVIGHHIESLGATTYVLAVQELHEDGAWHVHAIAIFSEKKNIRREDYFDFEGYHPNIQSTRDRIATRNYILKSAPVDEALYESGAFDDGKRGGSSRAAWKRAIEATTYDEVMAAVAEASPRDFLLSHDRVEAFAQKKSTLLVDYVPNPDDVFSLPQHITDWVMQEYTKRDRPKSLLLVGPSRYGKTQWARSLGSHVYWNGMMDLRTFNKDATYIIFDDFDFEFMPNKKCWFGAQKEFTITDKYKGKTTIQWGKPMIYLCNPDADPYHTRLWNQWYTDNTIRIEINTPFF